MERKCRYCQQLQPESHFEIANVVKDKIYRRHRCRQCKQKLQNARRQKIYDYLRAYKQNLNCSRCGFSDYRALEFHHTDPTAKDFSVADFVSRGASLAKIQKEIEKCCVLCANCHRIEHYGNGM
ncbi:hypothetical protein [Synechococcus sp. BDU 130192]|uniref:hypothetical protein n=1 Tax=Synechococcus sp. BDU 130192 TaxID=2042059 RepID=UPI001C1FDA89|nr:hypothetical protein [Synechococcus sp. BDU 130192]